jgi:hypothetical protein
LTGLVPLVLEAELHRPIVHAEAADQDMRRWIIRLHSAQHIGRVHVDDVELRRRRRRRAYRASQIAAGSAIARMREAAIAANLFEHIGQFDP